VTIVWCASMSAMGEMPMPGGAERARNLRPWVSLAREGVFAMVPASTVETDAHDKLVGTCAPQDGSAITREAGSASAVLVRLSAPISTSA
jgi:hypothetical protein